MENLRLLCTKCHNKKHDFNLATDDGRKKFNLSPKVREGFGKVYKDIMLHALSEEPLKSCYDDIEWDELHLKIIKNRRVEFHQFVFPHIRQFVEQKLSRTKIARERNGIGLPTFAGRGKWSYKSVQKILDDNNVTD